MSNAECGAAEHIPVPYGDAYEADSVAPVVLLNCNWRRPRLQLLAPVVPVVGGDWNVSLSDLRGTVDTSSSETDLSPTGSSCPSDEADIGEDYVMADASNDQRRSEWYTGAQETPDPLAGARELVESLVVRALQRIEMQRRAVLQSMLHF